MLCPWASLAQGQDGNIAETETVAPEEEQAKQPSRGELAGQASKLQSGGNLEEALPVWQELATLYKPAPDNKNNTDWIFYLIGEVGVGVCQLESGDWKAAAEHLSVVLEGENEYAKDYWCQIHAIASEAYATGGLLGLAGPHAQRALQLADEAFQSATENYVPGKRFPINRVGYTEAYLAAAKFANSTDHFLPAEKYLRHVLELEFPDGKRPNKTGLGTASAVLGLVYYLKYFEGLLDSDQPVLDAYQSALDMGNGLLPRDRFSCLSRMAHLHLTAQRYPQAEAILAQAEAPELMEVADAYDRAWHASLRNRLARETTEGSYAPFRPAWTELLEHMRGTERDGGVGFFHLGRIREIASEAVLQDLHEDGPETALATVFESQEVGFLREQLRPDPAHLEDLRSSLAPDELCLIFLAGRETVHAFSIPREGSVGYWPIEGGLQLKKKVNALTNRVFSQEPSTSSPDAPPKWKAASDALRGELLPAAQIEALKRYRRIRIVGRETLYNPLFEVFEIDGQPLGLTHAMLDWPTVAVGLHLGRQAKKPSPSGQNHRLDWLLIADPSVSEQAAALVPNREALQMYLPANEATLHLQGEQATFQNWLANDSAQVVQFLTHGVRQDVPEWAASVVLTADANVPSGMLNGYDILQQKSLNVPPLTILSICRGQTGALRFGDPSAGRLAGALLAKGSLAVLTSRGDASIYLGPTKLFTQTVREELAKGRRLDDAVLAARQAWAGSKSFGSPTHWSAWQIIGLGSLQLDLTPALLSAEAQPIAWLSWPVLCLILALLVLVVWRRNVASN